MRIEYKMLSFKFIFAGSSSNSIKITDVTPSPYRLVVGGQFSSVKPALVATCIKLQSNLL
jgi:hypothetical protein